MIRPRRNRVAVVVLVLLTFVAIPGLAAAGTTTNLIEDAQGFGYGNRFTGSPDGSIHSCRSSQDDAYLKSDHLGEYGEEVTGSALWVFSSADGWLRTGTWGSITGTPKYMRGATLEDYEPPMAVVIQAMVIDYQTVDGRDPRGLVLHLAHDNNDDNYTIGLLTPSKKVEVIKEYPIGNCDSGYVDVGGETSLNWKTGIKYIFKVVWGTNGSISIYCRGESSSDGYANGCPVNSDAWDPRTTR